MKKIQFAIIICASCSMTETKKYNAEDFMTLSDSSSYWLPKKDDSVIYPLGKIYLRK